jgi:hypothetical protein
MSEGVELEPHDDPLVKPILVLFIAKIGSVVTTYILIFIVLANILIR